MNYDGKVFRVVENADGEVGGGTLFRYRQEGWLLTATYSDGGIRCGQMVGRVEADGRLEFCYQHVTDGGELRSGVCRSRPVVLADGRVRLEEDWEWRHGAEGVGRSVVEEVAHD